MIGQSFHKRPSEGLRCSLKQPSSAGKEKYTLLLVSKGLVAFFQRRRAGEKRDGATWRNTATCRPQKPKRQQPGRKSIVFVGFAHRGLHTVDAEVNRMPMRARDEGTLSKGPGHTTRGPRAPLQRPAEPRQHGREVREPGKSGAWWAGLRSDWRVLGLRAGTQ